MQEFIELPASKRSILSRTLVSGVGVNDSKYITTRTVNSKQVMCPIYSKWLSMIRRCYDNKFHERQRTYEGATVCYSWLLFSNFRGWVILEDCDHSNLELDKDVKIKGNKIYSPDTCLLIPKCVNSIFKVSSKRNNTLPDGVSFTASTGRYRSQIRLNGKSKHLGYFSDAESAFRAYKIERNKKIRSIMSSNSSIAKYLEQHLYNES